ncbi:MAG: PHP domain-containing protein [Clostridia bacterium]|nr:PHP domain-containing protein [Clostridia bacterium]
MKYSVDHDYHIHSFLSPCSHDELQTPERIFRYAEENGFREICLTNHFWDADVIGSYGAPYDQTYEYIAQSMPLPQSDKIKFHFGCETDMDKNFVLGISPQAFEKMEFVVISTTHLQLTGKTIDPGATLEQRAELYIKRIEKVMAHNFDFTKVGIAHPASCHASPEIPFNELFGKIGEENIRRVFNIIAKSGAGVEINAVDFNFKDKSAAHVQSIINLYAILKQCGCRFYFASDAHHPEALQNAPKIFENAVNELGLTEDDRFIPRFSSVSQGR